MLLQLPVLVVLDEAYIEFSGLENSKIGDVPKRDNLIVLRTFSKRAALAGRRLWRRGMTTGEARCTTRAV